MATERLSMTKTREILRQKWKLELSYREIGLSVGSAVGAVWLAVKRATAGAEGLLRMGELEGGEALLAQPILRRGTVVPGY
jgi:hypothetical protein